DLVADQSGPGATSGVSDLDLIQPSGQRWHRRIGETVMDEANVVIKPLVTEKSGRQQALTNTYMFEVNPRANKQQIRQAVEHLYEVNVLSVRTLNRKGKPRQSRFGRSY